MLERRGEPLPFELSRSQARRAPRSSPGEGERSCAARDVPAGLFGGVLVQRHDVGPGLGREVADGAATQARAGRRSAAATGPRPAPVESSRPARSRTTPTVLLRRHVSVARSVMTNFSVDFDFLLRRHDIRGPHGMADAPGVFGRKLTRVRARCATRYDDAPVAPDPPALPLAPFAAIGARSAYPVAPVGSRSRRWRSVAPVAPVPPVAPVVPALPVRAR